MGYTIYFRHNKGVPTDEQWNRIRAYAEDLFEKHAEIVCAECDAPEDPPIVNHKEVWFNGKGEDSHETFVLQRYQKPDQFNFCKTARKPYNIVVAEILLGVRAIAPDWLTISSDGDEFN
jgi:hypothetical protein